MKNFRKAFYVNGDTEVKLTNLAKAQGKDLSQIVRGLIYEYVGEVEEEEVVYRKGKKAHEVNRLPTMDDIHPDYTGRAKGKVRRSYYMGTAHDMMLSALSKILNTTPSSLIQNMLLTEYFKLDPDKISDKIFKDSYMPPPSPYEAQKKFYKDGEKPFRIISPQEIKKDFPYGQGGE